jgi:hypothetical protein
MTEAEWLACTDPKSMLNFLSDKTKDRKLRLFACACCRRVWDLLMDERSRKGVETSERYADQSAGWRELKKAGLGAWHVANPFPTNLREWDDVVYQEMGRQWAELKAAEAAFATTLRDGLEAAQLADLRLRELEGENAAREEQVRTSHSHFLRDIFGGVFHPVKIKPSWLRWNDATVRRLAQVIYEERAFDRLPILADALEEAGCTNGDILAHCRELGPHIIGCWVVDSIMDKK